MPLNYNLKAARKLGAQEGSRAYSGSVGGKKAEQLYKLRFNRSSSIGLSMTGLTANANLELLSRNGKVLNRSAQKGHLNESIAQTVDKGIYYVRVSRQQGKTNYRLSMAIDSGASTSSAPTTAFVQEVLDLTNKHRQQAGLGSLRLNNKLNAAAQTHSVDMALNDFFNHTGSDQSTPFDRITGSGYDYALAAENIAAGYATPRSVVDAWMDSPGHRENILYPGLEEIGIGFYFLPNDSGALVRRYYWTQDFGKPE